jgi:dTDP-4-amino-4,6-dideoxygalactose transaminase
MGGTELNFINEAFETNWIAPLGANVNGFEVDLQNYTGRKHAAAITSGTAGLHLALILCGVKPGDEVICQSFTFAASANPIRYQGAVPVFIDSEPGTWNMDPDLLEKALEERSGASTDDSPAPLSGSSVELPETDPSTDEFTSSVESYGTPPTIDDVKSGDTNSAKNSSVDVKSTGEGSAPGPAKPGLPKAIIVVHLYGMPARMDRIMEIANKYGVPVIEDSAEALGSSINERKCSTYGKVSILSFNGNKIITTSGGGALLSDDEELVKKARFLATQARDDAPHYQHSELGYNYRMSNIVAGIGRGQMRVLDEWVSLRRANHDFYFENLGRTWWQPSSVRQVLEASPGASSSDKEINFPPSQGGTQGGSQPSTFNLQLEPAGSPTGIYFLKEPAGYKSNRWLTTILVNPEETGGITREDIRLALDEENIECRPLWKPMHMQPLYQGFPFYGNGVSEMLFEYGLCLPSGSNLTDDDRQRVVSAIRKVLDG